MTVWELLCDVKEWALAQEPVQAVLLVGSHARDAARQDSDVDLVIVAEHPDLYTSAPDFIARFGRVNQSTKEDWGRLVSIRVFYEGGPEVEFGITSPDWLGLPLDEGTFRVLSDGYKVLVDKNGSLTEVVRHVSPII